jgi:F-type H+-transporting ATPase subunit epsilon
MAETFPLRLVTPTGVVFEGPVTEVTAKGPLGEFGILAEHINFITSLVPGVLDVTLPDGAHLGWVVAGGLAEVRDGTLTLLADTAEAPERLDAAEARREEQQADAKVSAMSSYDPDYEAAHHDLELARARVEAAAIRDAHH